MIAKNLKYLRGKLKVTQAQFATIFSIPLKTYQAYEEGRSTPFITTLFRISEHFDIDVKTLCTKDLSAHISNDPAISKAEKILTAYLSLSTKERKAVDALLWD